MLISKWKILTEVRIYEEETISCHLATSLQYTKNKEKLEQGVIDKISRDIEYLKIKIVAADSIMLILFNPTILFNF